MFDKRGKLSPKYIGPFEILESVGAVVYLLALSPSLSSVHEVFHVSMLWKYTLDPAHVVDWEEIDVDTDETFEEGPVRIMDSVRSEKFQFLEKWQNRNFDYKIVNFGLKSVLYSLDLG